MFSKHINKILAFTFSIAIVTSIFILKLILSLISHIPRKLSRGTLPWCTNRAACVTQLVPFSSISCISGSSERLVILTLVILVFFLRILPRTRVDAFRIVYHIYPGKGVEEIVGRVCTQVQSPSGGLFTSLEYRGGGEALCPVHTVRIDNHTTISFIIVIIFIAITSQSYIHGAYHIAPGHSHWQSARD